MKDCRNRSEFSKRHAWGLWIDATALFSGREEKIQVRRCDTCNIATFRRL